MPMHQTIVMSAEISRAIFVSNPLPNRVVNHSAPVITLDRRTHFAANVMAAAGPRNPQDQ